MESMSQIEPWEEKHSSFCISHGSSHVVKYYYTDISMIVVANQKCETGRAHLSYF